MTITAPTELPENHAAKRGKGFRTAANTPMIGRLNHGEFDRLDAIVANMRIGTSPTLTALAMTLSVERESVARRMYNDRAVGLVDRELVEEFIAENGTTFPVYAFVPSERGWVLFKEALALMDRGEAAA